jgi:hypothetical protein
MIYLDKNIFYYTSFRPHQKEFVNRVYGANFEKISALEMLTDLKVARFPKWAWSPFLLFICYVVLLLGILVGFLNPEPLLYAIISVVLFIGAEWGRLLDVFMHASVLAFVTSISDWRMGVVFLFFILVARYKADKDIQDNMKRFRENNDFLEFVYLSAKKFPMKTTKTLLVGTYILKNKLKAPYKIIEKTYKVGLEDSELKEFEEEDIKELLLPIFKGEEND